MSRDRYPHLNGVERQRRIDGRSLKRERILLGCAVLEAMAPGEAKSRDCVAAACGVSRQAIEQIEAKALLRIRVRNPQLLRQLADEVIASRRFW